MIGDIKTYFSSRVKLIFCVGSAKATALQMYLPLQSTKHREFLLQEGNKNVLEIQL